MSELVHVFRNKTLENIHMGRICVVDDSGTVIGSSGDTEAFTYYRSSSKPIQALPVFKHRLHEKYGLTPREMAILAGSHAGEPMHLEVILSLLKKTGYSENDLIMLPAYPSYEPARNSMIRQGLPPRKALHNCSGKHIAAMMLAQYLGDDHRDYWRLETKAQQEILSTIALLSDYPADQIHTGVDGCGIIVFAVPLQNIARAYMHLACPDTVGDADIRRAVNVLVPYIHQENLMIRGTDYLCSIFNEDPNVVAKGGANGVYGFGLKKERVGVSLKLEDGTEDMWPVIIREILVQLHYDNQDTLEKLKKLRPDYIVNDNQDHVGTIKTVFDLGVTRF